MGVRRVEARSMPDVAAWRKKSLRLSKFVPDKFVEPVVSLGNRPLRYT